jgi:hypothetical protein
MIDIEPPDDTGAIYLTRLEQRIPVAWWRITDPAEAKSVGWRLYTYGLFLESQAQVGAYHTHEHRRP